MKSIFSIETKQHNVVGPSEMALEQLRIEVEHVKIECQNRSTILKQTLPGLEIDVPYDSKQTTSCQNRVNESIRNSENEIIVLKQKNQNILSSIESLNEDIQVKKQLQSRSIGVVKKTIPPSIKGSYSLELRASTTPATELIHTKFFMDVSKYGDIKAFDLAIKKMPDINAKNNQGRSVLDYAVCYMFEHAIKDLVIRGGNTSEAFLYSLQIELPKANKLLVSLISKFGSYDKVFTQLTTDNSVVCLDLNSTGLNFTAAKHLASALLDNHYLSSLDISNNIIDSRGAESLGKMLAVNGSINRLNLSKVSLSFEGIKYIATALENNKGVRVLNISNNNIPEEGGIVVARLIEKNKNIIDLDMANNNVMDMGAAYILARLAKNHSILRINLSNNNITDALEEDIIETMQQNDFIIVFNIDHNRFSNSVFEKIQESISCVLDENIHLLLKSNLVTEDTFSLELLAGVQQLVDFI